jgi:hypothetical protein
MRPGQQRFRIEPVPIIDIADHANSRIKGYRAPRETG